MEQTLRAQHREARREGSVGALVRLWLDVARDVFTTAPREHVAILRQDVGYALRALRRAPVFAASAVLTLAIGMSAMAGDVRGPQRGHVQAAGRDRPEQLISISNSGPIRRSTRMSYRDFQDYRAETIGALGCDRLRPRDRLPQRDGSAERITLELVTDNYFSMLGVQPAAGRLIQPNEGRARGTRRCWFCPTTTGSRGLAGDPSIVGRTIRLGRQPFTVIGVSSRRFAGTESLLRVSAYVPAWMVDAFMSWGTR